MMTTIMIWIEEILIGSEVNYLEKRKTMLTAPEVVNKEYRS